MFLSVSSCTIKTHSQTSRKIKDTRTKSRTTIHTRTNTGMRQSLIFRGITRTFADEAGESRGDLAVRMEIQLYLLQSSEPQKFVNSCSVSI